MAFRPITRAVKRARLGLRVRQVQQQMNPMKPTLSEVSAGFAPKYVLPERMRAGVTAGAIRGTERAVQQIVRHRGVTRAEAGKQLIQTREQIERRNRALRSARGRADQAKTLAALALKGIDPGLLKVERHQFVTPEGRFETRRVPGLTLGTRRLPQAPRPRVRPTPWPRARR